jgi:hypothetical protein
MERRIGQDTAALGKTPASCSAWNADRTLKPGFGRVSVPNQRHYAHVYRRRAESSSCWSRQKCSPALLIGRVPGFALNYVPSSGAPCASRRHASGLTPTAAENTRVK